MKRKSGHSIRLLDRYSNPESSDFWVDRSNEQRKVMYRVQHDELFREGYDFNGRYIKLEEVERFEQEQGPFVVSVQVCAD